MLRILLLEFCSKYVVCTCESPFMRYRTRARATASATGRFARATTPRDFPSRVFFFRRPIRCRDIAARFVTESMYARVTGYTWRVNRIIVRNTQVCVDDSTRREKMRMDKDFHEARLTRIGRICKTARSFIEDNAAWHTSTMCSRWLPRYRLAIAFIVLYPNGSNEILRGTSTANYC